MYENRRQSPKDNPHAREKNFIRTWKRNDPQAILSGSSKKGDVMRKTLKSGWKKLTLRKKIFFIPGSIIVFCFVHDLLELLFPARPTETAIYRIREERYAPPLKTGIEAVTEYVPKEPAAISVEADWLSPLPLHHWGKREYFLVSIQRAAERVFIIRKNMAFFASSTVSDMNQTAFTQEISGS